MASGCKGTRSFDMRPLDNKEIFVTNDYIFYVSTMRPLQICRKRFFTICLLVAGCNGLIDLMENSDYVEIHLRLRLTSQFEMFNLNKPVLKVYKLMKEGKYCTFFSKTMTFSFSTFYSMAKLSEPKLDQTAMKYTNLESARRVLSRDVKNRLAFFV